MILAKNKTIKLIGYKESTITQEAEKMISAEFSGLVEVIDPEDFLKDNSETLKNCTYGVAFTLDKQLRSRVIDKIETDSLDGLIYIHDTCVCYFDKHNEKQTRNIIGSGTFVAPMSTILLNSKIGKHCIIETYCLISHYTTLGQNVHLHAGTMIAGKTSVGDNCEFNFKSTVLPALKICSDVTVGAVSSITKNIVRAGHYVGNPARRFGNVRKQI